MRPSTWYLTGFLIPSGTAPEASYEVDEDEELERGSRSCRRGGREHRGARAAKKGFLPSSIGISFLVPAEVGSLRVAVTWGDYTHDEVVAGSDPATGPAVSEVDPLDEHTSLVWRRAPRQETIAIDVSSLPAESDKPVPRSHGLTLHIVQRAIQPTDLEGQLPAGTRSVSIFLVNNRRPAEELPDQAYAFQAKLRVTCDRSFVARPDPRGLQAQDWDDQIADLHYADRPEYATGHGVSVEWTLSEHGCRDICTAWIPTSEVEKTETVAVPHVELSMRTIGALADGAATRAALAPLVDQCRAWIADRRAELNYLHGARRETAEELLRLAGIAANRIERGVAVLAENALDAFGVANRAVARALCHRLRIAEPRWRAFQLAFVLLNLPGLVDPADPHRDTVDLLFFPTGGGKTEAYLGLAAFAMVYRRLSHPANEVRCGAGVSVMMRYTLRLLTPISSAAPPASSRSRPRPRRCRGGAGETLVAGDDPAQRCRADRRGARRARAARARGVPRESSASADRRPPGARRAQP